MKYVRVDTARKLFKDIFIRIKCSSRLSQPVIEGLIETSQRGVDSHGIRLIPHYIQAVMVGRINLSPRLKLKKTSVATASLDADHTFGITAASIAMKKSVELAKHSGIGCTVVSNSTHFGAAAIYALMAARENMMGFSFTNTDALVLPAGGKKPFLGTNPICFAAPCAGDKPFCLDMATSVISWNRLIHHRLQKIPLNPGWAADKDGKICTNPESAEALLPIGGYKGYGLGLMVEILCSLLTGMPYGPHISRMFPLSARKRHLGHFLLAIDVAKFQKISTFKRRMKELLNELRSWPPAQGFDKVKVAGDPEKETYQQRSRIGIPLSEDDLNNFRFVLKKLKMNEKDYASFFKEDNE